MNILRGDIFYIHKGGVTTGQEQESGIPAVVVSNDKNNEYSNVIEVVYCTTKQKTKLPTHCTVLCQVPSIALCEQIFTVSKERVGEYVRSCTEKEMEQIDKCMMISLGIEVPVNKFSQQEIDDLKMKLEGAERKLDYVNCQFIKEKEVCHSLQKENDNLKAKLEEQKEEIDFKSLLKNGKLTVTPEEVMFFDEEKIKLKTERDLYKKLYGQMLERVAGKQVE